MSAAVVYSSYQPDSPPAHPGPVWTRFVCISDTHSRTQYEVPPGDVLLHAGDLCSKGTEKSLRKTVDWLRQLPHELKIIIAGNHDLSLDSTLKSINKGDSGMDPRDIYASRELLCSEPVRAAGVIYLERQHFEITTPQGTEWKVYGSPAAPYYVPGAFQYMPEEGKAEWSKIPQDVEILLTHTPPHKVLDTTRLGKNAGCPDLSARIEELNSCRLHVFGHIHEARGAKVGTRTFAGASGEGGHIDLVSVNAALYDCAQAIIVDLKKN